MVKLKINNVEIKAKEGSTILEAARANNIYIPTLCYLKDLTGTGACCMYLSSKRRNGSIHKL